MRVENFEAALLLFLKLRAVGKQPLLDLFLTARGAQRRIVLEHDLDGEGPVCAAVAVITRHKGLYRDDAAALDLLAEHGQMVPPKQGLEFVLKPPLHPVEIPDRFRTAGILPRRRLSAAGERQQQEQDQHQANPHHKTP